MNSAMYVDEESRRPGNAGVGVLDPLSRVFEIVHGKSPSGLSQEEIILRTIEVIGSPGYGIDKNLAKMYLAAVIQMDPIFRREYDDMVIQAANAVFGINFNSVEEVEIALSYD